ncbi:hypothetical protein Pdw03_6905 [Penicillium digitatum]|uniref:Uncharacterized protein n=3 Tax=Penicillium digitatum TaxID=36651 RepID=K9FWH8_PEND2|nr:hypothetical protein PDIP_54400 [Penicillium digitatum Pd1]EKV11920.1 hypothetical protein PDIP_54400 [Penicillium digitatum Pd1]EKV14000.1 hypothetical protein PDIG_34830 [Penicillium digitatum PHI26]KAG0156192.1 hypothetical protein PDIDSM_3369 [Penicillium digitatum]QQK43004.1 hypothetical protein Pdw03_6905 [Penicillium digitatum]
MPRTSLRLHANLKASEVNTRRIWMPLHLDNLDYPQNVLDRQTVLDLIRSVYDPLLIAWLADPSHTWVNQFSRRSSGNQFQTQILARMGELPSSIQSIESEKVLGEILYDILRFYRLTDAAWRVPALGAATTPPSPPPPPPPPAAPAPDAMPAEGETGDVLSAAIAIGVVIAAANLEVLTDAATQVLDPATAARHPTPLEILAEVASSAEPSPLVSPTASLDILAAAAATLPYAPMPTPAAAPTPVDSPAPRTKRGREDEPEYESEEPAKKKQAVSPK